jgi:uncharacterized protein YmfQ (DUF2313 family)
MPAPLYQVSDYVLALQALLPRGRAWPRDSDATITSVVQGLAPTYQRSNQRANDLLVQAFPSTAYELLGEWESTLGLPNKYNPAANTAAARQAQVVAALTDTGGQSVAYFIGLAARLGHTITITQFRPYRVSDPVNGPIRGVAWAYAWQINVPMSEITDSTVEDDVEATLATWDNAALLAVVDHYKPAHTAPFFVYS